MIVCKQQNVQGYDGCSDGCCGWWMKWQRHNNGQSIAKRRADILVQEHIIGIKLSIEYIEHWVDSLLIINLNISALLHSLNQYQNACPIIWTWSIWLDIIDACRLIVRLQEFTMISSLVLFPWPGLVPQGNNSKCWLYLLVGHYGTSIPGYLY